jgi:hypothetical protein
MIKHKNFKKLARINFKSSIKTLISKKVFCLKVLVFKRKISKNLIWIGKIILMGTE